MVILLYHSISNSIQFTDIHMIHTTSTRGKGLMCTNQMHECRLNFANLACHRWDLTLGTHIHVHHLRPSKRYLVVLFSFSARAWCFGLYLSTCIFHFGTHLTPDAFQGVVFVVKAIEPLTTALLAIPLLNQTFNLRLLGISG